MIKSKKNLPEISYYEEHNFDEGAEKEKEGQAKHLISILDKTDFLKTKKGGKALDVGCGVGIIGLALAKKYSKTLDGLDLAPSAVKIARAKGVKAKLVDLNESWPFNSSTYDQVYAIQILEHVFNTDNIFKECFRVLRPGGILIVSTPNIAAWYNRLIFLFGYQPFFTEVSTIDKTIGLSFTRKLTPNRETLGHLRVFGLKALVEMAKMYGFETKEVLGGDVEYLPKPIKIFDRFFANFPSLASDLILIAQKKNAKNL